MAKRVVTIWLLLILTAPGGHSQQSKTVSAKEILDRMVSVYGSCKSYVDKGETREVFFRTGGIRTGGSQVVIKPFTTAFVRPSDFRFEVTENKDLITESLVVWRDKGSIRSWWSLRPETKYYETLLEPVARATGVSSTSALVVPSMLFQNLGDRQVLQSLTELSLVGEEKVSGRNAYRIRGKNLINTWLTIWIDKETFLLVKLFQKTNLGDQDVHLTIRYEPKINLDVPPEKLAFKH